MNKIAYNEISMVKRLAGVFPRHPLQVNEMFEADGEIIALEKQQSSYLVAKTDSIREEITEGLYKDPYLIGWMAVTVTTSDLAATGANIIGLLLSLQLPKQSEGTWVLELQRGIKEACAYYETYILGGDTNFSDEVAVNTTGIGRVDRPLLRKKIRPGDLLYTTAPLGAGNSFAYATFFDTTINIAYKPCARLRESKTIREYATACIDTSDGLFPALAVLAHINGTGLRFFSPLQEVLCDSTKIAYKKAGIPAWLFLAGPHGEYELLFSIAPSQQESFEKACAKTGWSPFLLGEATEDEQVYFTSENKNITCHPAAIANLFDEAGGNIQTYFQQLLKMHQQLTKLKTTTTC